MAYEECYEQAAYCLIKAGQIKDEKTRLEAMIACIEGMRVCIEATSILLGRDAKAKVVATEKQVRLVRNAARRSGRGKTRR